MVFVTGDCHAEFLKLNTHYFPEQKELTRDDFVIICGDFGGVWNNSAREKYWLEWLNDKHFTTLFVDGNHENFDLLSAYPVVDFHGGKAHQVRENVYHLMRGYCFDLCGKTFFAFGGASSHDIDDGILDPMEFLSMDDFRDTVKRYDRQQKLFRVKGYSWWPQELPSDEEMRRGTQTLAQRNMSVDFVISHCLPQRIAAMRGFTQPDTLTTYFDSLIDENNPNGCLKFGDWYCGHYHMDENITPEYHVLYYDLVRIV